VTFYRPVGTRAIITPWNYPLLMFAEFVAPGLATGNAHVVKPPAHTAFTVLAAMDVLRAAGLPEGLVNILPGGPLNNEAVAAKMDRHVADGHRRGANLLRGGQRRAWQPTALYYEFTVADQVPLGSLFATEESSGPVVPIITADGEEELLSIANSDPLGLQAAVFTRDISKAYRFAEELAVGQVVVNDSTCWWDINMPFSGARGRRTGWGRIGGKHVPPFC
jgi:acyl-CoA reductase-like NAD-dependent aldehyde dehydrogenase